MSLARLLREVVGVPAGGSTFATHSFRSWLDEPTPWPPSDSSADSLWLIDTRDPEGRSLLRGAGWKIRGTRSPTVLILTGSGPHRSWFREVLRRMRHPGTARWPERRLRGVLDGELREAETLRLGFDDGLEVPTSFKIPGEESSGGAYLCSREPLFRDSLWAFIRERLGCGRLRPTELHLRARGAAVTIVESDEGPRVVRVVPEGPLQGVVAANHDALVDLRNVLAQHPRLLGRIPAPLLKARHGSTLVLGETRLSGVLAWTVFHRAPVKNAAYEAALHFLADLRSATRGHAKAETLAALIGPDLERLEAAPFVGSRARTMIERELNGIGVVLGSESLEVHASHGDYGPGNLLVSPETGALHGVIDWDTFRPVDLPGIDRVNLEIQWRRCGSEPSFARAVQDTWLAQASSETSRSNSASVTERALFGAAVCRYITRSLSYPEVYRREEAGFMSALEWLAER